MILQLIQFSTGNLGLQLHDGEGFDLYDLDGEGPSTTLGASWELVPGIPAQEFQESDDSDAFWAAQEELLLHACAAHLDIPEELKTLTHELAGRTICSHCCNWDTQGCLPHDKEGQPLYTEIDPLTPCIQRQGWCYEHHDPHPECALCTY